MFKKPVEAKALQRLSGADKKKLRRTVKERFPQASDADIDAILPPKAEITVAKLPNRAYVYAIEGEVPMLFDVDGRGHELFPTVYALWKAPDLLPAFELKGGEVSRYILGGADLMFPGISIPPEGLPSFSAGQPWAVKVPGNPAPIAVGTTTMSSLEALKAGLRGKALHIAHSYRDSLWESVEDHYIPNAGFLEDIVVEDAATSGSPVPDDLEKASADSHDAIPLKEGKDSNETPDIAADECNIAEHVPVSGELSEELPANVNALSISDSVSAEETSLEKENVTLSTEEVDNLLDKCLLQALHTTVKDKDLPMPGSTFMISAKEDKYKKETVILTVNRAHRDYRSFKPEKRLPGNSDQKHDLPMNETRQVRPQLDVVEIYKPSTHVNPIFTAIGADIRKFYSANEASDVVFGYVDKEHLVKPTDKATIVLDAILCDALYKGTIKKGSTYPTEIHKKDLGATFLSRMQVHHRVSRGNEVDVRKGSIKPIQIMAERRQGNKKVTRVSGVESFLLDAESLASELQKKFACSTSVAELPGKRDQYEVLVQGGVIDELARHLVDHYGVPKRYIEVLDKTKK